VTGNAWDEKRLLVLICFHHTIIFDFVARQDAPLPPCGTACVETAAPGKALAKEETEWNISSPAART